MIPTVTVCPAVNNHSVTVTVNVDLPRPVDLTGRVAALALAAGRDKIVAEIAEHAAVQRWQTLGKQIDAARKAVASADRTFDRVQAAKKLLEDNPTADFASRLREIEAQYAAAVEAKAAAERDLDTVRHLIPRHWIPAAEAVHRAVSAAAVQHMLATGAAAEEVGARLKAAAEKVEQLVAAAVAEHLVPVAAEALAVRHAKRASGGDGGTLADELRAEFCGVTPDGIRPVAAGYRGRFEVIPTEPPAPPPPPPPVREMTVIKSWGVTGNR